MNYFEAIILGIVEGITEFLPISSTAHLDFTRYFLNIPQDNFIKSFMIIIQFGAILAVVFLYWEKIIKSKVLYKKVMIAFIPTGILGFLLYKIIKSFLLGNTILALIMLILGGIVILFFERNNKLKKNKEKESIEDLSIKELIILGLAQSLAVVPGVSRSGAVIIAGRSLKLSKVLITEFSFLLAVPTMFFATLYDIYKNYNTFEFNNWNLIIVGFVISFIVALLVVKWLLNYIKKHSFAIFGYYRIIFGLIILLIVLLNY